MKNLFARIKRFIARLFLRQAIKNSVKCNGCHKPATSLLIEKPFVVAYCNECKDLARIEIARAWNIDRKRQLSV